MFYMSKDILYVIQSLPLKESIINPTVKYSVKYSYLRAGHESAYQLAWLQGPLPILKLLYEHSSTQ